MWSLEAASSSGFDLLMRTLTLILALATSALAQSYTIRPESGARFALEVFKTGLMSGKKHVFLFERYEGTLTYDAARPENSSVELRLEASSIANKDSWIGEKDVKKVEEYALTDMLDAARNPHIRFTSSVITRRPDGKFDVQGTLTIRERSRPVTVEVSISSTSPVASANLSLVGKAEVRLKDFDIKPRSAVLGVIGTKSEMKVEFSLLAVPR